MDIVGLNIRRIRQSRGLLQKELAGKAEMDPSSLSKLERGEYTWTKANLARLADALAVSVSAFFVEGEDAVLELAAPEEGVERTLHRILGILEKWDASERRCA